MKNPSRRNHYIPEFYLRKFCNPETKNIFRYVKVYSGNIQEDRVFPKETGYLFDSNTFTSSKYKKQFDEDHLEKNEYSKIDQNAVIILEKQLQDGLDQLTLNEKTSWAIFLNTLLERSPQKIIHLSKITEKAYEEALDNLSKFQISSNDLNPKEYKESLKTKFPLSEFKDQSKIQHFQYMTQDEFIDSIVKAPIWINTVINSDEFLITSDYPIHLIRDLPSQKILGIQIALSSKILQSIYFPSDSSIEFHLKHVQEFIQYHNLKQIIEGPNVIYSDRQLDNNTNIQYRKAMELYLNVRDLKNPC